jgi:tetratricopeptide (TPR) repeat protein
MFEIYKTYGLINWHDRKWDEAILYFQKSIEIVEKLNALYYLSDSHFELGLLFGEKDDLKKAKEHLKIAASLYDKLGLEKAELAREKLFREGKTAYIIDMELIQILILLRFCVSKVTVNYTCFFRGGCPCCELDVSMVSGAYD